MNEVLGDKRLTGTVKWFDPKKGYGFIIVPGSRDIFVHINDLPQGTVLEEGQSISFSTAQTQKGTRAVNVVVS